MHARTTKHGVCDIYKPHRRRCNMRLLPLLAYIFKFVCGLFATVFKGLCGPRSRATSRSNSQSSVLPHYIPPLSRVDVSIELTGAATAPTLNAQSLPDNTTQTPTEAIPSTKSAPKSEPPAPLKSSPTTAQFIATLTDLEAHMNNNQFYDLERELEELDNQFDFSWMPPPNLPEIPISVLLPQAPPVRRDGKTIQILPMIYEVSENSPDSTRAPPFDPRWSIVTFQPLWGPRRQVRAY